MSSIDPKSFNTPVTEILKAGNIDNVARAVLTLTREVAILNDRVMVLEEILEQNGIAASETIDTYQPTEEFQARADKSMQAITRAVLAALQGVDGGD